MARKAGGGMTVAEAGRMGGRLVSEKYGPEFYEKVGKKGGSSTANKYGPEVVVRAARSLPPGHGQPVVPPLVQSVAFDYRSAAEQDAVFGGDRSGYVYGRYGTPTTAALEQALAELDGVEVVTCFVTGMAGIAA